MAHLSNSHTAYGSVTKSFHWLTALLILSLIPLGIIAENLAHAIESGETAPTQALVTRTAFLFSLHKTLGVAVFFVALLRILWAISQKKPGLLNGDKPAEAFAAETVHWLLYGSLVLVPLTGWVHHAATTGFAPIWWPFGQNLPFVPKDEHWAEISSTLHYLLQWVLIGAIALHLAGALKHHVIDKDATLSRMLPGRFEAQPTAKQPGHATPLIAALGIWSIVLIGASFAGWFPQAKHEAAVPTTLAAEGGNWQVEQGTLGLTVTQMGSEISGQFANWSAEIQFAETADSDGKHGEVRVEIQTATLDLGSVTAQATGSGYLEASSHPIAIFDAEIMQDTNGLEAIGDLTIRDITVPLTLPFTLEINEDHATASGSTQVDRRSFNIGQDVTDEGSLAFAVGIRFDLTASRKASD